MTQAQTSHYLSARIGVEPARGQSFLRRDFSEPIRILMVAVAMLLLLACVNVATLLFLGPRGRNRRALGYRRKPRARAAPTARRKPSSRRRLLRARRHPVDLVRPVSS
jgi:hypothetical protein